MFLSEVCSPLVRRNIYEYKLIKINIINIDNVVVVVATSALVYLSAAAPQVPSQSYAKKSKSQSADYKAGFHEGAVRAHNDFETKASVDGDNLLPCPNSNTAFCDDGDKDTDKS